MALTMQPDLARPFRQLKAAGIFFEDNRRLLIETLLDEWMNTLAAGNDSMARMAHATRGPYEFDELLFDPAGAIETNVMQQPVETHTRGSSVPVA
jgi:hypothetical protein